MRKFILAAVMLLMVPALAFADPAAAMKCRANLAPEAQLIYDSVSPLVTPTTVIRDVIKRQTSSLVLAGKVKRATAPDNAKAASESFRTLRECADWARPSRCDRTRKSFWSWFSAGPQRARRAVRRPCAGVFFKIYRYVATANLPAVLSTTEVM